MPPEKICTFARHVETYEFCEIDSRQQENVGSRESTPSQIFASLERSIEKAHAFYNAWSVGFSPFGVSARKRRGERVRVNPNRSNGWHEDHLDPAIPHFDFGNFTCRGSK